ncbi:tRNA (adenosine(37)-N6)-threonylcarbamoyltransferase complex transferase subunit TsaD [Buchnera aphidicola]|jgi:N6-L-threonylcarbamoyladenine synthase|uniref:tRNA N6-adenosine threonylcarbamoyltransferase n=1 Tax=Buchnera aphidicola subsp. Schizaphis graminum (strain Sg) TaxID=198804 RepID=TSAD_BUCAP|nr:tRNA (adenosine(37)-N6)-threonylcarbamoyltransferase complex transferase subunit TsaD [Buchnera aphidicola]Q8KA56.1 RecName: Full=tRNA N6-adenosine threonylcarbamoyltransferase; AltName: Full=N6-L-threonylcarbamoyladenine synthase; Short=t(6)A synthase; AltName: Full=t(6)A37 threonylcarbamoyladenosine biosynthesis protein TsaD; AltName: Full=tRNA threonylcarbamoyladenosine biosynthesis protein TsaD [Buchnera aphidicola str. Sg (Schizaphis graminum)]AAM67626.1 probable O-sialoglycoprotein endop
MKVLGIETSCDDTGIAIYDVSKGLLINELHSQKKIHANYGGIIPELASREHTRKIIFLLDKIFKEKNIMKEIDLIAYTAGPGLAGSLLVGATFACSLGFSLNIPVLPVNHMEAHLLSPMLEYKSMQFPFIALLVSGKHTQIIAAYELGKYEILGNSLDDAAGEAFDKVSKMLGLKYPSGRELSSLAAQGIKNYFYFPRPMIHHSSLNFSFSGLKTFTSKVISNNTLNIQQKANIARAFEDAVIDVLLIKTKKALYKKGWKRLVIAGGVSANTVLRKRSKDMMENVFHGKVFYSSLKFCTDNGAMIAYLGSLRYKEASVSQLEIIVKPKWSIDKLSYI